MKTNRKHTIEYVHFVGRRLVEDRCLMIAGSLTYTSLLALVPVFAVTIALTAQLPLVRDIILEVKSFILKNLLPESRTYLSEALESEATRSNSYREGTPEDET